MKSINRIIKYITFISLIICTIISVIDFCCFDKKFYFNEYSKYNTLELIGTSDEDLENITNVMLDYLKDRNDDLDIMYNHNGEIEHVFKDIELIHMKDVKDLYRSTIFIRNISFLVFIAGFIYIIVRKLKFKKEYYSVLIIFVLFLCIIGLNCLIDFDGFWISFHKIFFTKNDYWLLDPRTCILVNLYTGNFFFDLCTKICLISFIIFILYSLTVNYYDKKTNH